MRKRLFSLLVLLFLLGFCTTQVFANDNCSETGICISSSRNSNYVDIYVENRNFFNATVALNFQLNNMGIVPVKPLTATYPGHSKTQAVKLVVNNINNKWSYKFSYSWMKGSIDAKHDTNYIYTLPYLRGQGYPVTQGYNGTFSHFGESQYAIDFVMPEGTSVCAAREGLVVDVKQSSNRGGRTRDYIQDSNYIMIQHPDGTIGQYGHLKHNGALVSIGQWVSPGTPIGLSGNTGFSSQPHLHFAVYQPIDGKRRISHPVKLRTSDGIISEPVVRKVYVSP